MSFSPHEFERSEQPLSENLQWLEDASEFHVNRFAIAMQGVASRSHEHRDSRIAYYNSFYELTEQMNRLDMVPDNEVCHRLDIHGYETWVAAMGRTACRSLGRNEVRIVIDSNLPDSIQPDRHKKGLQDWIIDRKKQKLNVGVATVYLEAGEHEFRYGSKTPPRFDHRKFHAGNGVGLRLSANYKLPQPESPRFKKSFDLRVLNRCIDDLTGLLGLLDELTEQVQPEWNNGQEMA